MLLETSPRQDYQDGGYTSSYSLCLSFDFGHLQVPAKQVMFNEHVPYALFERVGAWPRMRITGQLEHRGEVEAELGQKSATEQQRTHNDRGEHTACTHNVTVCFPFTNMLMKA